MYSIEEISQAIIIMTVTFGFAIYGFLKWLDIIIEEVFKTIRYRIYAKYKKSNEETGE